MPGYALGPAEGRAYGFHGSTVVMKVTGATTLGQLAVMESTYPAGLSVRAWQFRLRAARLPARLRGHERRAGQSARDHRPTTAGPADCRPRRAAAFRAALADTEDGDEYQCHRRGR